MAKRVLCVRNYPNKLDINFYNSQEIGLCKSIVMRGFDCDIVYYTDADEDECIELFCFNNSTLRLMYMRGLSILKNGIYLKVLDRRFLSQYDMVITTEYNQIMTVLLSKIYKKNLVLYHGPYKDHKRKYLQKIFDFLFIKYLNKNIKQIFVKSTLAKEFLHKKGFEKVKTVGVGLDTSRLEAGNNEPANENVERILSIAKGKRILLYIGEICENKNTLFLIEVLRRVLERYNECLLVIIGSGKEEYKNRCMSYAEEHDIASNIIFSDRIKQSDLIRIYNKADLFLLPSKSEIFGMVLLESMFFNVPAVSSVNGGSTTLVSDGVNGFIIENFDIKIWAEKIVFLLQNPDIRINYGKEAHKTIINNFTWDKIADAFIENLK